MSNIKQIEMTIQEAAKRLDNATTREASLRAYRESGWKSFGTTVDKMWVKGNCRVHAIENEYCIAQSYLNPNNFDSATEKLAEAIALARMLNATQPQPDTQDDSNNDHPY